MNISVPQVQLINPENQIVEASSGPWWLSAAPAFFPIALLPVLTAASMHFLIYPSPHLLLAVLGLRCRSGFLWLRQVGLLSMAGGRLVGAASVAERGLQGAGSGVAPQQRPSWTRGLTPCPCTGRQISATGPPATSPLLPSCFSLPLVSDFRASLTSAGRGGERGQ